MRVGVWPIEAHAQQRPIPIIGYLHFGSPGPFAYQVAALRQGLSETGYIEGPNVAIEYRWGEGKYDQLPTLAADLIGRQANVIVAVGPPCAHAAKSATTTIPIVFVVGTDPVADGLVATLSRPGANMTGASILAVDLLHCGDRCTPTGDADDTDRICKCFRPRWPPASLPAFHIRERTSLAGTHLQAVLWTAAPRKESGDPCQPR